NTAQRADVERAQALHAHGVPVLVVTPDGDYAFDDVTWGEPAAECYSLRTGGMSPGSDAHTAVLRAFGWLGARDDVQRAVGARGGARVGGARDDVQRAVGARDGARVGGARDDVQRAVGARDGAQPAAPAPRPSGGHCPYPKGSPERRAWWHL